MTGHTWIPQSVLYKVWLQLPQLVWSGADEKEKSIQAFRHMVEWVERRTDDKLDSTFSSGEHLIMGPKL